MWLIFGLGSIIFCILNLLSKDKTKSKYFMFLSLSLAALTLCAFYTDGANRIINEDYSGLIDTFPTISKALWILTLVLIFLNGLPLFISKGRD